MTEEEEEERCGEVRIVAGKRFVCVRPPHGWKSYYMTEFHRSRRDYPIEPDRHWFRREEETE